MRGRRGWPWICSRFSAWPQPAISSTTKRTTQVILLAQRFRTVVAAGRDTRRPCMGAVYQILGGVAQSSRRFGMDAELCGSCAVVRRFWDNGPKPLTECAAQNTVLFLDSQETYELRGDIDQRLSLNLHTSTTKFMTFRFTISARCLRRLRLRPRPARPCASAE